MEYQTKVSKGYLRFGVPRIVEEIRWGWIKKLCGSRPAKMGDSSLRNGKSPAIQLGLTIMPLLVWSCHMNVMKWMTTSKTTQKIKTKTRFHSKVLVWEPWEPMASSWGGAMRGAGAPGARRCRIFASQQFHGRLGPGVQRTGPFWGPKGIWIFQGQQVG